MDSTLGIHPVLPSPRDALKLAPDGQELLRAVVPNFRRAHVAEVLQGVLDRVARGLDGGLRLPDAPPVGSATMASMTPRRSRSWAVIFMLVAASWARRNRATGSKRRLPARSRCRSRVPASAPCWRWRSRSPLRSRLADDDRDVQDAERQAAFRSSGRSPRPDRAPPPRSRIGAGGVDEGQDRQFEAVGEFHQAHRLAVALGPRHAEIVPDLASVVAPFSWPSTQTASPRKRPKPPTMASSSPKARSPASGVKSSIRPEQ